MKILYGVQGTGNGHISRARALNTALGDVGLDVDFIFSGRDKDQYFNMEEFGNYRTYPGLSLSIKDGKLDLLKTSLKNKPTRFFRDVFDLEFNAYDLVISDFEPITAWAARYQKIHTIGISHQNAFSYDIPKVNGYYLSKQVTNNFAPTNTRIGLHYYHFGHPILPPLISIRKVDDNDKNTILVYMGFENLQDIISLIKPFKNFRFIVYAKVSEKQVSANYTIKPLSFEGFHKDLASCEGVICNAGFELTSEALSLGKKLLVKPLNKQYEQLSNCETLKYLNLGMIMNSLNHDAVDHWLSLHDFLKPLNYPDVAQAIAEAISQDPQLDIFKLKEDLWRNIHLANGSDQPTLLSRKTD